MPTALPRPSERSRLRTGATRLTEGVLVLLAVSLMTFLLVAAAPGDVATAIVARRTGGDAPAALVAQERQRLGLDKPLVERYWTDLGRAIHGDLGVSARTGQPVIHDLATRLPVTLELAGAASLLTVVFGIGAGVLTVLVRSRAFHAALRMLALLGVSVPAFALAYLLVLVFALQLHWFPTQGLSGHWSLVLPSFVLAAPFAAALSRVVAARMGEVMAERYIITARARGVSWPAIVLRHALPNAGVTILVVSGTQLGYVLSANVIVETIFSWPGIGDYFVQAVEFRDLYAIQATVLLYAGIALAIRSISMVLAAMLDPRARTV